jgi:hypothetical protein
LTRPKLMGEILSTALCETDKGDTGICVKLRITNVGPPSLADSWGLVFQMNGKTFAYGATHSPSGVINIPYSKGVLGLKNKEMLYEKANDPIPAGGRKSGFLFFTTKGINYSQLKSIEHIDVLFRDASGNEYQAMRSLMGHPSRAMYEPGVDDPFLTIFYDQIREQEEERKKASAEGSEMFYAAAEKIANGVKPRRALQEVRADTLDTNDMLVDFCANLKKHGHPHPFDKFPIPQGSWLEFLRDSRRRGLDLGDEEATIRRLMELLPSEEQLRASIKQPSAPNPDTEASRPQPT